MPSSLAFDFSLFESRVRTVFKDLECIVALQNLPIVIVFALNSLVEPKSESMHWVITIKSDHSGGADHKVWFCRPIESLDINPITQLVSQDITYWESFNARLREQLPISGDFYSPRKAEIASSY